MSILSSAALSLASLEIAARQRFLAPRLALRVQRLAQELDVGDAGNFDRVLEAQEQAFRRALVGFQCQQILTSEGHAASGHLVPRLAAQHIGQGRFARAVGAHDRVDFPRGHMERETLEDRLVPDAGVEIGDGKH